MLGKRDTTGRDSFIFFGADGELMSIKWKNYKTIFRYTSDSSASPAIQSTYIKPQFPMIYDLGKDQHEDVNLFYTELTVAWLLAPNFKLLGSYEASIKKYPNVKVGEDFKGYKK
jgi:hypothetical protein